MKITKQQLKKIIKEELKAVLEKKPKDKECSSEVDPYERALEAPLAEDEKFMQKASEESEKKGKKGDFKKWCKGEGFNGVNQSCIDAAYDGPPHRKEQATLAVTYSRAKGGAPSLKYPDKKEKK